MRGQACPLEHTGGLFVPHAGGAPVLPGGAAPARWTCASFVSRLSGPPARLRAGRPRSQGAAPARWTCASFVSRLSGPPVRLRAGRPRSQGGRSGALDVRVFRVAVVRAFGPVAGGTPALPGGRPVRGRSPLATIRVAPRAGARDHGNERRGSRTMERTVRIGRVRRAHAPEPPARRLARPPSPRPGPGRGLRTGPQRHPSRRERLRGRCDGHLRGRARRGPPTGRVRGGPGQLDRDRLSSARTSRGTRTTSSSSRGSWTGP